MNSTSSPSEAILLAAHNPSCHFSITVPRILITASHEMLSLQCSQCSNEMRTTKKVVSTWIDISFRHLKEVAFFLFFFFFEWLNE